jgi:uncharacterized protein (UPF0371 family)
MDIPMIEHFLNNYGFPATVCAVIAIFAWRAWLWYTTVRWPAEQANRKQELDNDGKASEAITGIKIILADIAATTGKTYELLTVHNAQTIPAIKTIADLAAAVELLKTETVKSITQSVIESVANDRSKN